VVRVVFLVMDGLPSRHVGTAVTPVLAALASETGCPPGVAEAVMPADTYPNHASFVTGVGPDRHGVLANWYWDNDGVFRPAWEIGPRAPTLVDACRARGRSSAAVVGDQHLVGVMGLDRADDHWPPGGELPAGTPEDRLGYADDPVALEHLASSLEAGYDLVIGHLNTPDTAGHLDGPDTDAAADCYRSADACLSVVRDAIGRVWDDTVLIVVSDHTMETVDPDDPIDLGPVVAERGIGWLPEGGTAFVRGDDPDAGAWLDGVDGVESHFETAPGLRVAVAERGRWFGIDGLRGYRGMHGNSATREQVAVVSGGHPAAGELAARVGGARVSAASVGGASVGEARVRATDWAPTMASLLGVRLPDAVGRVLVEGP
jgi:arylsulfatase A-like enzyme